MKTEITALRMFEIKLPTTKGKADKYFFMPEYSAYPSECWFKLEKNDLCQGFVEITFNNEQVVCDAAYRENVELRRAHKDLWASFTVTETSQE